MASKKLDFEKQLIRLKSIVNQMDQGATTLDESLKLFEEGVGLYRSCKTILDDAERRVSIIMDGLEVPYESDEL